MVGESNAYTRRCVKLLCFKHGHFATNEDKVRDYRKMVLQVELAADGELQRSVDRHGTRSCMLVFLDATVNTRMLPTKFCSRNHGTIYHGGWGIWGEDVREAARAFTAGLLRARILCRSDADAGEKYFLGAVVRWH